MAKTKKPIAAPIVAETVELIFDGSNWIAKP
jgi:hypothetical protein